MIYEDINSQIISSSKYGDRVYLRCPNGNKNLSFQDILNFKNKFNRYLSNNKISEKDKVCTIVDNSKLLICLFLSIISNNRIFVPINPSAGKKEIEYILKKTKPKLIIASDLMKSKIKNLKNYQIAFIKNEENFIQTIYKLKDLNSKSKQSLKNNIAEILFTSGSTGDPKGVVLTHKNIMSNVKGLIQSFNYKKKYSNFLSVTPLYHNNGQFIPTLIPLVLGHSTTTIKPLSGLLHFINVLKKFKINYTSVMATHINYLLSLKEKYNLNSLVEIYCGGAKLDSNVQKIFEKKYKVKILANYGLTECSSIASTETNKIRKFGSVGKPLNSNLIKISKKKNNYGEILIKGNNVFKEYLSNKKLTNKKVINGYLYTGDKGYFDRSGYLFIEDRIDNMINVSGENIYPSEIEKYTNNYKGIRLSVALGIKDPIIQNKIILIYEKKSSKFKLNENHLDKFLTEKISLKKIPKKYFSCEQIGLKEIPKAPNQKILRKKLNIYLENFFKNNKIDL